jgi:hypothetical protein
VSRERAAVIALHAAVGAAIWRTHGRTPPKRLYNSRRGGLSRAVVFLNYPTAVAAIATLPHARHRALAIAAAPLCAVVALPGVVDEGDLDARPGNIPAVAGVVLAVLAGGRNLQSDGRLDGRRLVAAAALGAVAAPWILAEVGVQTRGMAEPSPSEPGIDRVHVGHHEGMDGVLLALGALLLARRRTPSWHRHLLALQLAYGTAVAAQDAWHEQVVKRGWASRRLPDVIRPAPTRAWAGLLASAPIVRRSLIG